MLKNFEEILKEEYEKALNSWKQLPEKRKCYLMLDKNNATYIYVERTKNLGSFHIDISGYVHMSYTCAHVPSTKEYEDLYEDFIFLARALTKHALNPTRSDIIHVAKEKGVCECTLKGRRRNSLEGEFRVLGKELKCIIREI